MRVRILQLGRGVVEHSAAPDATLQGVLEAAGFGATPPGVDVRVNGASVAGSYAVRDGDVVTLIPRIKGGRGG